MGIEFLDRMSSRAIYDRGRSRTRISEYDVVVVQDDEPLSVRDDRAVPHLVLKFRHELPLVVYARTYEDYAIVGLPSVDDFLQVQLVVVAADRRPRDTEAHILDATLRSGWA